MISTPVPPVGLVTVAHGTRRLLANRTAAVLTERAAAVCGLPAATSYVELCRPSLASVVQRLRMPAVVVPLLLSTGHHLRSDIPAALGAAVRPVALAPALGPDPLLAGAQVLRLHEAGALPDQPVVMVAAGTRDPAGHRGLEIAVEMLAERWCGPVRLATLSGPGSRPGHLATPDSVVSPYLLAEGHFAAQARLQAASADRVAEVLGVCEPLVSLVVARARHALRDLADLPAPAETA